MPEHLRALAYILALATAVFVLARSPASALAIAGDDFIRRRNFWFAVTFTAFLAHNFWIYIFVAGVLLMFAQRREKNKLAMYLFLLLAVPPISSQISGMGMVNYIFEIEYVRLLALVVLLPAYLSLRKQPGTEPFGRLFPDKLLAGILILDALLMFQHRTLTGILREGFFYAFVDVFLPYYVASRALRNLEGFRDALMSFAVAAMVLSAILVVEFNVRWLLFSSLERALGVNWAWNTYLSRGASVRATGTIGHAIAAGYVVAVALGIFLYLRRIVPNRTMWGIGIALLLAGLIGPLSRGPWVGAALMLLVFIATGPAAALNLAKLGLLGLVALPVLLLTPYGSTFVEFLPFVGTVDEANVVFRQTLAQVSYRVFLENPLLGRYDFVDTPAMQALKGSWDGRVDLVNTYVVVGLGRGLVGLTLFVGFFLSVIFGIYKGMRGLADRNDEYHVLGQALIATLLGILVIIATVSPILLVPLIYWIAAGVGVAYAGMLARASAPVAAAGANSQRAPAHAVGVRGSPARAQVER